MKKLIKEDIDTEQRTKEVEYSKIIKNFFTKNGVDVKVRVLTSRRPNRWIEVWQSMSGGKDIPNEVRKIVMETMGWKASNWDDIQYGNIQKNHITLHYNEWQKVLPVLEQKYKKNENKLTESRLKQLINEVIDENIFDKTGGINYDEVYQEIEKVAKENKKTPLKDIIDQFSDGFNRASKKKLDKGKIYDKFNIEEQKRERTNSRIQQAKKVDDLPDDFKLPENRPKTDRSWNKYYFKAIRHPEDLRVGDYIHFPFSLSDFDWIITFIDLSKKIIKAKTTKYGKEKELDYKKFIKNMTNGDVDKRYDNSTWAGNNLQTEQIKKVEDQPASSRVLWALHLATGEDTRNKGYTQGQAIELLQKANAEKGYTKKTVKKSDLKKEFIDYWKANEHTLKEAMEKELGIKSIVQNDPKFFKEPGKKYPFFGGGMGFAWVVYDKRSKIGTAIIDIYHEISRKLDDDFLKNNFDAKTREYYRKLGAPLEALIAQNMMFNSKKEWIVAKFMESKGVKNVTVRSRYD